MAYKWVHIAVDSDRWQRSATERVHRARFSVLRWRCCAAAHGGNGSLTEEPIGEESPETADRVGEETGVSVSQPPHRSEIAHDFKDIEDDLEFEREQVGDSIKHDYSTSEEGIVPLDVRRPLWHFMALFLTFEAGFSYVFVGFTLHDAGFTLGKTAVILALGVLVYLVYAV